MDFALHLCCWRYAIHHATDKSECNMYLKMINWFVVFQIGFFNLVSHLGFSKVRSTHTLRCTPFFVFWNWFFLHYWLIGLLLIIVSNYVISVHQAFIWVYFLQWFKILDNGSLVICSALFVYFYEIMNQLNILFIWSCYIIRSDVYIND